MTLLESLPVSPIAVVGICFVLYIAYLSIYRLYFHPLAKFPGSKLAALTLWYEFYYDCLCRGQYLFKIRDMHEKYGPIIRINPYEIHIATPDFFNEIYSQTEKRDVWGWRKKGFGISVSTLTTLSHDLHRRRRAALNPLFSKQRIVKLQPVIQESVDALMGRIRECGEKGEVVNLKLAFAAFTADVAMQYFFGKSQHKLDAPDFDYKFHDAIQSGFNNMLWMNHFPWVMDSMTTLASHTPSWVLQKYFASGQMTTFIAAQRQITIQVRESLAKAAPAKEEAANHTMFDQILSSRLPPEEKSFTRLVQEGGLMVGAATVSTAWSLTVTSYCLVAHPEALKKVKDELASAFPGGADTIHDLVTLEHLPYFTAVIQESLRIGIGASHRSPRISPDKVLPYTDPSTGKQWIIPAGTPVCMSHALLFRDPSIFPDPTSFRPERWIENPGLEKYQFAFSKGTRACIGINLAMTELYLMVAHIFARYGSAGYSAPGDIGRLELFETDSTDIECVGDGGVALVKEESKGVRFRVILEETEKA